MPLSSRYPFLSAYRISHDADGGQSEEREPMLLQSNEGGLMKYLMVPSVTVIFLTLVLGGYQARGQEKQQPANKSEMKSTGKMSMDEMMKECSEHHQAMTKSVDQLNKTLEAAKQSNDPGKMRAAIDQTQKHLLEMKEHMAMCGNMMSMMEKMPGMGEMMKSKSK